MCEVLYRGILFLVKLYVWGIDYELLVLGLWLIMAREEDNVGVGRVVVVYLK
jgi:hypothetical protein